jgi:phosphatidylinositol-3-phosphatase
MCRAGRWSAALAIAVILSGCHAAGAGAARVGLRALPGGRIAVRLSGAGASGAHEIWLDGRRVARVRGRTADVSIWRRGASASARWRRLVVRRPGSRRALAQARFAVGAASSRTAPTLVLLAGPAAHASRRTAVLRFSAAGGRPRCGSDGGRLRACSSPLTLRGLRPGAHRFALRAANRHGRAVIRLAWTVAGSAPAGGPCGTGGRAPGRWDHVVWIVFENKTYSQIVGSADAPYINSIAKECGSAANFHAEAHPSLPNYIAMTSGSTQGIGDDDDPSAHPLGVPSIFSQLGGGWRALEESMPSKCDLSNSGQYAVRHNPAAYYTNTRTACHAQDVPLAGAPNLSARFTFITPNLCHDMHSSSCASDATGQVRVGDQWLAGFLPSVLSSSQYRAGRTAVFITWDEDDYSSGQRIATFVVAPSVPRGAAPAARFDHYSLLRTTEQMLGLPAIGQATGAASMLHAFRLG